jgi:hypothetical protein
MNRKIRNLGIGDEGNHGASKGNGSFMESFNDENADVDDSFFDKDNKNEFNESKVFDVRNKNNKQVLSTNGETSQPNYLNFVKPFLSPFFYNNIHSLQINTVLKVANILPKSPQSSSCSWTLHITH